MDRFVLAATIINRVALGSHSPLDPAGGVSNSQCRGGFETRPLRPHSRLLPAADPACTLSALQSQLDRTPCRGLSSLITRGNLIGHPAGGCLA
ncbi:MAG: hypothetical protein NTV33_00190 [Coprothermobacterota bacterium]|nr:hypothetical protein [Coprothermobacterota bacterium]